MGPFLAKQLASFSVLGAQNAKDTPLIVSLDTVFKSWIYSIKSKDQFKWWWSNLTWDSCVFLKFVFIENLKYNSMNVQIEKKKKGERKGKEIEQASELAG